MILRILFMSLFCFLQLTQTSFAQNRQTLSLIRDTEIEALVRDYASPILKVAGLGGANINIALVNDKSFNAFVADGRRIFVNVGTIMQSETPGELIGVLAHETGHLAGNHLVRLRQQMANAQIMAAASMLVGIAAAAAGAAAGSGDVARAGASIASSGGTLATRNLLAYQRSEELAADRAALSYLQATRQSAKGMVTVFERFADQTMFSGRYIDPYARSHPMPRERINQSETLARQSPYYDKVSPLQVQARHDLVRAKLVGYLYPPQTVNRRFPKNDQSMAARYARAISASRYGQPDEAGKLFDQLISQQPGNAYFYEAKGQMLFETGRIKQALPVYKKALSLAPNEPLFQIAYGSALVESNQNDRLDEAIALLEKGLAIENASIRGFRYLGQAYQRKGQTALAQLSAAQGAMAQGQFKDAQTFATLAKEKLKRGSPGWLKADDIIDFTKAMRKERQ
jgi:predicted Zn-dependent protease